MTSNTILYMCKRETFKQLAGEQCKVICGAWASKHTYITVIYYSQSFVGLWTHNGVWKCLVHAEESVLLQVATDVTAIVTGSPMSGQRTKLIYLRFWDAGDEVDRFL